MKIPARTLSNIMTFCTSAAPPFVWWDNLHTLIFQSDDTFVHVKDKKKRVTPEVTPEKPLLLPEWELKRDSREYDFLRSDPFRKEILIETGGGGYALDLQEAEDPPLERKRAVGGIASSVLKSLFQDGRDDPITSIELSKEKLLDDDNHIYDVECDLLEEEKPFSVNLKDPLLLVEAENYFCRIFINEDVDIDFIAFEIDVYPRLKILFGFYDIFP